MANRTANQGRYEDALLVLEEARRLAVSADDPPLRIKTAISRGNILFSLGRRLEAFDAWEDAAAEGDNSGETVLAAMARLYTIRAKLVLLSQDEDETKAGADEDAELEELRTQVLKEMTLIRSDSLSTAAGCVTLGMAEKQLGRWADAEAAVKRALDIHEKNRYLEDAAYDWFLIASIRSVSERYPEALEALGMAILFDRRAENSFGLASSWQALGDVYQKAGRPGEAAAAYRRAQEIYRAIGLGDRAKNLEGRF
jgi:tetratricopeptide (TPR) repeat protein